MDFFFSLLARLLRRPILGGYRNLIGSPCLLSTYSLSKSIKTCTNKKALSALLMYLYPSRKLVAEQSNEARDALLLYPHTTSKYLESNQHGIKRDERNFREYVQGVWYYGNSVLRSIKVFLWIMYLRTLYSRINVYTRLFGSIEYLSKEKKSILTKLMIFLIYLFKIDHFKIKSNHQKRTCFFSSFQISGIEF